MELNSLEIIYLHLWDKHKPWSQLLQYVKIYFAFKIEINVMSAHYSDKGTVLLNFGAHLFMWHLTSGWLLLGNMSDTIPINMYAVSIQRNALARREDTLLSSSSSLPGFFPSSGGAGGGGGIFWQHRADWCRPRLDSPRGSNPERLNRPQMARYSLLTCLSTCNLSKFTIVLDNEVCNILTLQLKKEIQCTVVTVCKSEL